MTHLDPETLMGYDARMAKKPLALDAVFAHTHVSGLWDASKFRWADVLRAALRDSDIVTITEWTQTPLDPAWFKDRGFTLVRFDGDIGRTECAIAVKDATFKVTDRWCIPISKTLYALGSGKIRPRVCLAGVEVRHLESDRVVNFEVFHSPSAIEGKGGLIAGVRRVKANLECYAGIRQHRRIELKGEPLVVAADWNLDLKKLWVQTLLKTRVGMQNAWKRPWPRGGSHGPRLIDGLRYTKHLRALGRGSRLGNPMPPFDHIMVKTVLGLHKRKR